MTDERFKYTIEYFRRPFVVAAAILAAWGIIAGVYYGMRRVVVMWDIPLLFVGVVALAVFCGTLYRTGLAYYYRGRVLDHDIDITRRGFVFEYYGAPGVGKTRSMTYDGYMIAQYAAEEKRFEYLLINGRMCNIAEPAFANMDEMWCYYLLKQSVEYFASHNDRIPFLLSNYAIRDRRTGAYCSVFKPEHFLQQERLPEGAVILDDEAADHLSNKRSDKCLGKEIVQQNAAENIVIDETLSKSRHYGEWRIIMAEQSSKEVYIGARRVVSLNRYLARSEDVCRPKRLIRRYARLKARILENDYCTYAEYARISALKNRIASIGYTRIFYRDRGSENDSEAVIEEGDYVLPFWVPFEYASRFYQLDYRPLAEEFALEGFEGMYAKKDETKER